jgi:spore germination protein KB
VISPRQLFFIIALARIGAILVLLPGVQSGNAMQDAWISVILATGASILIVWLGSYLAMKHPEKSLGHFANDLLGRLGGTIATGILALSFYVLCLIRVRLVSLVIISHFMPRTPGWGLAIPVLLTASYGAMKGPDTIGRASELLFTVMAAITIGTMVVSSVWITGRIGGLKPVLSRGFGPVLAASVPATFLGIVSGLKVLALGRFTTEKKKLPKATAMALLTSGLALLGITIDAITTLGPAQAQKHVTPMLALASTAFIQGVLERLDLVLMASWVLGVTFDVTALLLSSSILIGDSLGADHRKVTAVLFFLGLVPVSHRITDIFTMRRLHSIPATGIWAILIGAGTLVPVLVAYLIKKRKGGS